MHRTPDEASDETISRLLLSAETILGNNPVSYVIDLRRKYAFEFRMVGTYRHVQWECVDMLTYDPGPDSTWHIIGYGATKGEAQGDLLEKIAYAVAHE